MSMRRVALAALVVPALVSVSCGGTGDATTTTPVVLTSPRAVNATTAPLLPTSRFTLPQFDYAKYKALMAQLHGTPVAVNLWGAWCGPCRQEAPFLARAAKRFGRQVQFLGVDVGDPNRVEPQVFIRDFGWSYPSVYDPPKQILSGLGFIGPPITMLFDRSGKLADTISGPIPSLGRLTRGLRKIA